MTTPFRPIQIMSYEDRARWGVCPSCAAPHGVFCFPPANAYVAADQRTIVKAHLGRLQAAPERVALVAVDASGELIL